MVCFVRICDASYDVETDDTDTQYEERAFGRISVKLAQVKMQIEIDL